MFVGYCNKRNRGFLYNSQESKVIMLTNSIFLEHNNMNNNKAQSKILLEEFEYNGIKKPPPINVDT